jgi:hypothetical protein
MTEVLIPSKDRCFYHCVQTSSWTHPASCLMGTMGFFFFFFFLGVKQLGQEAVLLPPSSAEVKNIWSYTSSLLCVHGVVLH